MLWEHKWLYIELRPKISLNLILKMDATTQPKNFDKLSALNDRTRQNVNWFVYLVTRYKKVIQLIQICRRTVYPKKYAHGFVVLCFVVVTQSFIMNSHEVFIHIYQGCFAGSEVSLMDMGKSVNVWPQQSTAKQKPCAYFLGYTVRVIKTERICNKGEWI